MTFLRHKEPNTGWNNKGLIALLGSVGAFHDSDHYVYHSGRHGKLYINKDALYLHPQETDRVALSLAFATLDVDVDVVVGSPIGGVILAHAVARALMELANKFDVKSNEEIQEIQAVQQVEEIQVAYAEKQADDLGHEFKRDYAQHIRDRNVLVVEDIVTTGKTARSLVQAVHRNDGNVVGCVCIVNRTGKKNPVNQRSLKIPFFHSLLQFDEPTYSPSRCPLCKQGIPINTTLGYGAKT